MGRLIDADAIEHCLVIGGRRHGKTIISEIIRRAIQSAPTVDAIPIQYILTTIREWNRDGYAESAEALEILVMNWDKENTEWAERKEEYVTLHHDDIHFIDEDAERAFYESLAERTRSFTDEECEFYKKVNREKMQKTGLDIYDLMNKKEEE